MSGPHPSLRPGREERGEVCPGSQPCYSLVLAYSGVSSCRGSGQEPLGPGLGPGQWGRMQDEGLDPTGSRDGQGRWELQSK